MVKERDLYVHAAFQEIYHRYLAATMSRDAAAVAALFTPDGVFEAPLLPFGMVFPRRLDGQDEIRAGLAEYYLRSSHDDRKVNLEETRYALHETADSDVGIVEVDTVFESGETISLVQIFRLRDGKIAMLRDYFAPSALG